MADIARALGLSRSTVSFALNRRSDINIPDETRERVLAAAAQMGYRRHAAAQSLAAQRTDLIGVVTDIGTSPFAGGILMGAQRAAWEAGKFLLVVGMAPGIDIADRVVEMLLERRVEGLIFATQTHRAVEVPSAAVEVPTVLAHCFDPLGRFPSIVPDEAQGGYAATSLLLEAGHRRIALINLEASLPAAAGRAAGFRRAMSDRGVQIADELVRTGDATAASGYAITQSLLELPAPPTAAFCANDRMAMGAYDAIKERGLRIPADISVIGFDNQEVIAGYLHPPLSSIALPFEQMGSLAVEAIESAASGHVIDSRIVQCPVVKRESTAPPT